jgi:hypothetical protein
LMSGSFLDKAVILSHIWRTLNTDLHICHCQPSPLSNINLPLPTYYVGIFFEILFLVTYFEMFFQGESHFSLSLNRFC